MTRFHPGDRVRILDPKIARPGVTGEVTHIVEDSTTAPARYVVQWSETLFRGCQACFGDGDLEPLASPLA